jgi:hypothetical protein
VGVGDPGGLAEFVSHVSMVALVYSSVAAWQATRTEVKQDENGD